MPKPEQVEHGQLNQRQRQEFAARGFLLRPQAVPPDVVAAASAAIDELSPAIRPDRSCAARITTFPRSSRLRRWRRC